jgi:hypothetical protein
MSTQAHRQEGLFGLLEREAGEAEEPRATALRDLAKYLDESKGRERLHDPALLRDIPELRGLVAGFGHSGSGGESSFLDAVERLVREGPIKDFAALPQWAVLGWPAFFLARFLQRRARCPQCAKGVRRNVRVCTHCGARLDADW